MLLVTHGCKLSSQMLLLRAPLLKLKEYAPTCKTLIAPPHELAPNKNPKLAVTEVRETKMEQTESWTKADAAVTDVVPHILLLLIESPLLKLQEYAPTCNALTDPPYAFHPRVELLLFVLVALQFKQTKLLPRTVTPLTLVESVVLLLEAAQLKNRRKRRRIRRTHWLQMNRN